MNKSTWDRFAPFYARSMRADREANLDIAQRIAQRVTGKDVLELACGPGQLAKAIAPCAHSVVATDYSDGMVRVANQGDIPENLSFAVADATDLPYEDGSFDAVIMANALHIMPEPDEALSEIRRVVRKGGLLIAPNFVSRESASGRSAWIRVLGLLGVRPTHHWTAEAYRQFLEERGWTVEESRVYSARVAICYTVCRP